MDSIIPKTRNLSFNRPKFYINASVSFWIEEIGVDSTHLADSRVAYVR